MCLGPPSAELVYKVIPEFIKIVGELGKAGIFDGAAVAKLLHNRSKEELGYRLI